jgi:LPS export ABC transporter permease LptG/LPS export ABC transporter permease LptF
MISGRKLIANYVIGAALPYVFLAFLLLTAVLFVQQASRFAELALYVQIPLSLLGEIAIALLPSVLTFTLPAAVLAGIIIGFSRLGSDSELVAMRAAGVGSWSMLWPVLLIGLIATGVTTYIHLEEAPRAARDLRKTSLKGSLQKLESPVEPRVFTTEIPGYVIYVREGDKAQGTWGRVFIYSQQPDNSTWIVTATSGRIDSSADRSELVLSDATRTKIPPTAGADQKSYVVERLDQLRIAIDTGRAALIESLSRDEVSAEELEWNELKNLAFASNPDERREGQRILHRRIALAVSPFFFALVGGALGMRVRRGGRSVGVLLSIGIVIVYYLISLFGESLARAGTVSPVIGAWSATALIALLTLLSLTFRRLPSIPIPFRRRRKMSLQTKVVSTRAVHTLGAGRSGFPSLLDIGLFRTLSLSFLVGFASLASIVVIFTLFELWRFVASNHVPLGRVARYVLFLLPLLIVELFPATMLIAVLITYALLARHSETIAWCASGQSVYRLMLPGLLFAIAVGAGSWLVQEHLMPYTNAKQDSLRAQIRGGEARATTGTGRQWLASSESNRLYSYEFDEQHNTLQEPTIYDFAVDGVHLSSVTTGSLGLWTARNQMTIKDAETLSFQQMGVERQTIPEKALTMEPLQVFKPTIDKPSQLSAERLNDYLESARRRGVEVATLAVALQHKYASPFSALVMAFIGIPLALSFGKRGAIIALCAAVGVSIFFWGINSGFQQLGNHGLLPPSVAGWSPAVIFAAAGTYFLSRVRT